MIPGQDDASPRITVLVIEDEASMRRLLRTNLEGHGFAVIECERGDEGMRRVQSHHPDVIFLDIRMPGLSGIDLYERLRIERPDVIRRMIFSTGDLVSEEAAAFVHATRCTVLQKPFELAVLRELAERVAEGPATT